MPHHRECGFFLSFEKALHQSPEIMTIHFQWLKEFLIAWALKSETSLQWKKGGVNLFQQNYFQKCGPICPFSDVLTRENKRESNCIEEVSSTSTVSMIIGTDGVNVCITVIFPSGWEPLKSKGTEHYDRAYTCAYGSITRCNEFRNQG